MDMQTLEDVNSAWIELCHLLAWLGSAESRQVVLYSDPAIALGHDKAMQLVAQRASVLAEALCPDDTAALFCPGPETNQ